MLFFLKSINMYFECGLIFFIIAVISFLAFYKTSPVFNFSVKYFTYNCSMIVLPLYALFVGLLRPKDVDNFHRFAMVIYNMATKIFKIDVQIEGVEHLHVDRDKIESNFVIVCNHQSSLDMMAVCKLCPHDTTFVAKRELLYAPVFGPAAWLSGVVFVERGNSKSARGAMDNAVQRIKSQKMNLWIFPEGTRRQVGTLLPFKKGAFHVAQQAQLPIIPIVVYDYTHIFNKKKKIFGSGTIRVKVLPPVSTKGMTSEDVGDLTDSVRQQMLDVYHSGPTTNDVKVKEN